MRVTVGSACRALRVPRNLGALSFDARRVPPSIREHELFDEARTGAQEGGYRAFSAHIEVPLPFLTYLMVFGPPAER